MLSRLKSGSSDSLKGEVYFRIVPQLIKMISYQGIIDGNNSQWLIYLQKGMQILGKSLIFFINAPGTQFKFDPNQNKFDFQIASQKNFIYTWSLYSVDQDGYENRVATQNFSIKQYYNKYENTQVKNGFDLVIILKNMMVLDFKLFIQNTANNIMGLANGIVPQSQQQVTKALALLIKKTIKEKQPISPRSQKSQLYLNQKQKQKYKDKNKDKDKPPQQQYNTYQHLLMKQLNILQNPPKTQLLPKQPQHKNHQLLVKKKKILSQIPRDKKLPPEGSTLRIQQQQQQQSILSQGKKNNQIKLGCDGGNVADNLLKLSDIEEDREREDVSTPLAMQSKYKSFGQVNEIITVQMQKIEKQKTPQLQQSPIAKYDADGRQLKSDQQQQWQQQDPIQYQTKQQNNQHQKQQIPQTQQQQPFIVQQKSSTKLKKVIIVLLILLMLAGIIGSLLKQKQSDQDKSTLKPNKVKKKGNKTNKIK